MQQILDTYKPDIMALSEANINPQKPQIYNDFSEYNIELNKMSETINFSRNAVFINNKISYKRRHDLEENLTCTIWIQINIPKSKPILIMGGYRQWTLLEAMKQQKSYYTKFQLERFKFF